ncbi:MAG TPA: hypothetical protein VFL82_13185, partial [Thermomicrobiales bacterium]|nr:hypothetical protein [Thermomicrobiales bacterium]
MKRAASTRPEPWNRIILSLLMAVVVGLLASCGGSSDKTNPTVPPTHTPPQTAPSPAVTAPPSPSPTTATPAQSAGEARRPSATFPPGTAQTISDGICQAQIPYSWIDNGTGRGTTASGARYVLFGGAIPDNAAWQQAITLVKQYAAGQTGSAVEQGTGFIRVTLANDTGFEYRERFGTIYCDFSVTSRSG